MKIETQIELWVVYKMTLLGRLLGPNAVCEQGEWDKMERDRPGYHTLIREGITSESEAEHLARESPGGTTQAVRLKERMSAPRTSLNLRL
jgi:hypothetical protein